MAMPATSQGCYELRFRSLFNEGRGLAFPCGEDGQIDLDSLSDKARNSYLGARALIGREYAYPVVIQSTQ
ncbi:hypothetical protein Mpe_B0230 (plasmid) [Methylibium petroleiphilum PM1]|uniref:Uncharacterized protein n=1 Tax=Methylibium petroleiphilum (strain ATCC BAA-1232 / LMG 22953 / PM1) TaxID=420662 RepID=A2SN66_METPP|nr:hypothetical protein Mpe_B0230 [Methylibium petroleiphilum PM1]